MIQIQVHHYLHADGQDKAVALLKQLLTTQGTIMSLLDDLKAADVAEDAKIDALIQGHKDQKQLIVDLQSAVTDLQAQVAAGAADTAAIQSLIDAAKAKSEAIDAELGVAPVDPVVVPTI